MTSLNITSNKTKRTFTIRKYNGKELISKLRTLAVSRNEFEELEYNTESDWKAFLSSNEVITLK